ncbi:hypothetical protein GWK47_044525 [Chionoecetes opilio]|uniref:Uncharacterized protein n=1 Tax=Chionoecetes opilio TaxID=41210 RepID=A0A8J4Y819_CHIOP|nr:hypothetical protein GWK47_044525 [Chionoecetes opilio]
MDGLEQVFSLSTPAAPWSSLQQLHCSVPAASCQWRGNNHNVIIIFIPVVSVWFLFYLLWRNAFTRVTYIIPLMVQPIPLDKFFVIQLAENVSSGTKMPELALAEELMEALPQNVLEHFMKGSHVMRHKMGLWNGIGVICILRQLLCDMAMGRLA